MGQVQSIQTAQCLKCMLSNLTKYFKCIPKYKIAVLGYHRCQHFLEFPVLNLIYSQLTLKWKVNPFDVSSNSTLNIFILTFYVLQSFVRTEFLKAAITQLRKYFRICSNFGLLNAKQEQLALISCICNNVTNFFFNNFTCFFLI